MSMFALAISSLTTSNLPWFMDLTFQVPMQYCSLHHWTLLPSPVLSTVRWWCCFGSISSTKMGIHLSMSYLPFHTVRGFLKARILKGFAILICSGPRFAELSTMTHLSWVALHGMVHSFVELEKTVVHMLKLISFLWSWFSFSLSSDKG